jgi:hypothetical protein
MNDYEQKQERRRERLEGAADRREQHGKARLRRADEMASVIPMGQPILVGHHSEHRDRRYRQRIHDNMRKGFSELDQAKALRAKADAVGTGGISSDDPEAVTKLQAELAQLEQLQKIMPAANRVVRAFYKAGLRDAAGEGWSRYLDKLREVMPHVTDGRAEQLLRPDFCGRIGFADYQLTNNGANVRRIRARIEQLQARAVRVEVTGGAGREYEGEGFRVVENLAANRVQVFFPGKPCAAARQFMKSHGYRWAPSEGAWQRMATGSVFECIAGGYLAPGLAAALAGAP